MTTSASPATTDNTASAASIRAFDALVKGSPAPDWLRRGVIECWGIDPAALAMRLIAVSENATFLAEVSGEPSAVVRVHRPGYVADPAQITSEMRWVEAIGAETDVVVSQPVSGVDGAFVHELDDERGARWTVVMFTFVPGSILEDVTDPIPYFREIGRITAALHTHVEGWTLPEGFTRFEWDLPDAVGPTARWGPWEHAALSDDQTALLQRAETRAREVLAGLTRTPSRWGLIHSDLRPSNIMIQDERLIVIDFDDSGFGWLLYDFASALSFYEHLDVARTMAKEWMAGYEELRPLTDEDKRLACAFSVIRRLSLLGWTTTHRPDALPPELSASIVPGSCRVAEQFLASETWLLDPA